MQPTLQFIAPDQTKQRFPTVVWRLQKKGRVEEVVDVYEGKMKQFEYSILREALTNRARSEAE